MEKQTYSYDEAFEKSLEYFKGDELAARVWVNKYAVKDSFGKIYEQSPEDMHWRLANEVARVEAKYTNGLSAQELFELFDHFKYIVPQGSPMTGIGNDFQVASLSNCFVIGMEGAADSYGAIIRIDEENEFIYFSANGVQTDEDPYHIRYYRIGFDGNGLTDLTPERGTHKAWFSRDMQYLVDVYSTANDAPVAVLRSAKDGSTVMALETADISRLEAEGWKAPEVFAAKGRDGKTDMWGLIIRPSNFDPNKKYPILEYIYQGPGDHYVPKAFTAHHYYMSSIAELGFIVVFVDGMGTSFRSREFENVCYKNLKDAGLPDHISWIRAAAEKYPYMDIDRVGIHGHSGGGFMSTAAILMYPDFFDVLESLRKE